MATNRRFFQFISILIVSSFLLPSNSMAEARMNSKNRLVNYTGNFFTIQSHKKNLFDQLPDEVLGEILNRLDLKSLVRFSQVDSRFNQIAHDRFYGSGTIRRYMNQFSQFIPISDSDMDDLVKRYDRFFHNDRIVAENLSKYEISKTPVSQLFFSTFMGKNPSKKQKKQDCRDSFTKIKIQGKKIRMCPDLPVENVSWEEVQLFLNRVNGLVNSKGYKFDLPTESQTTLGNLGKVSHNEDQENPRWQEFEDFVPSTQEWYKNHNGRNFFVAENQRHPGLPGYMYAHGILGTAYLILRATADSLVDIAKGPYIPYYSTSFRLVREKIPQGDSSDLH
jgi:hypothetical protein